MDTNPTYADTAGHTAKAKGYRVSETIRHDIDELLTYVTTHTTAVVFFADTITDPAAQARIELLAEQLAAMGITWIT
ncbi:hypothetical protein M8C13_18700 [Crossiella sp. SN42]|uniref:hypothetical protein n=1 Tax=Crossiella sp. SN42 TaxID=2944808 RepID=UPI00207C7526|nr:hypothetical protein [Crossiella sp. SN42]MCO1577788.1 hypothetical protein [Crossiella sp. SN42]